jgi:predicted metal-dependent enzyme (double-stranded beta helix superfamily)
MAHTLKQFAAACHRILKAEPGATGQQKVCTLLQDVLQDDDFVATHLGDDVPERKVLYEDPELGFCILAHVYNDAKESPPHDHGPSWAIYGQARGETEMTDWKLVEPASPDKPGKVRKVKTYTLTPGMAFAYDVGALHSPRRSGPTRLIRLEGMNMDKVQRLAYRPE